MPRIRYRSAHPKTYLAQVDGEIDEAALAALHAGMVLNGGLMLPAQAPLTTEPAWLWPRDSPVRSARAFPLVGSRCACVSHELSSLRFGRGFLTLGGGRRTRGDERGRFADQLSN
jgi:hypothetical protein